MKWTAEMAQAAKLLGLDPEDERHRALLLKCVHAASKRRGRPKGSKHWTLQKLRDLGRVASGLEVELVGNKIRVLSDDEIAKKIVDSGVKDYQSSKEVIRRRIPEARFRYETSLGIAKIRVRAPPGGEEGPPGRRRQKGELISSNFLS
jgi:hypothetical protein